MPVCPRCRAEFERGAVWCATCEAALLDVVRGDKPDRQFDAQPMQSGGLSRGGSGHSDRGRDSSNAATAVEASEPVAGGGPSSGEERLVLLLEEPLPEIAEMIAEFLQNCGIRCIVNSESIGLLYRLPAPGAPISRVRVYVLESDFQEARELVAHFFDRS